MSFLLQTPWAAAVSHLKAVRRWRAIEEGRRERARTEFGGACASLRWHRGSTLLRPVTVREKKRLAAEKRQIKKSPQIITTAKQPFDECLELIREKAPALKLHRFIEANIGIEMLRQWLGEEDRWLTIPEPTKDQFRRLLWDASARTPR